MPEVPKVYHRLTDSEAVDALQDAYMNVQGNPPSPGVLALMAAQADVETGGFNLPNNNWGGVKEPNPANPYFWSDTKERDPKTGELVVHHPPDPVTRFASRPTPAAGAQHYVEVLKSRAHWWDGLHSENLEDFVNALATAPKYFTADPASYADVMRARLDRLLPLFEARIAVAWVPPARYSRPPSSGA